ncbi:MAG: DNA polymerase III subunit gamma/tau, partial [Pseudomonadota bacterium]
MTTDPSNPDALDRGPSDPPDPKERAEEAASRDEGPGLFGDDAPSIGAAQPYRVLARKYRPRRFEDLIGQEAMVRVLESAFKSGRIAHAFILTGVRGVGKTTTARLIARALNYTGDGADAPSLAMDTEGQHCAAIAASSHPDVIEMDAASRTGIGDVREIIDSVRYHPVSARYKVYIIDEVHMLSTAAFNGLLKTLEEPPPHCKFIFATTEIRKVPVTVLSRCQRFDLKRVRQEVLADHLAGIAKTEGAEIEDRALALIARASEGSVRDALSLLDQAITLAPAGQTVSSLQVQDMLGLSDRGRTIDLFTDLMAGQVRPALDCLRTLYDHGADPQLIVSDLL